MKKLRILLVAAAASALLPSAAGAACAAVGTIPTMFVNAAGATISVRTNLAGSVTTNFTTTNQALIILAANAQASHENVHVVGNAVSCPTPVGGERNGGVITQIIVSPG